jgi:hypothetical protein
MVAEGVSSFSAEEMRDLRDWFQEKGWSIRVICFVRHLSSWLHSMVAQRVTGQRFMDIEEAVAEFAAAGGLVRPRIENLREVFPDAAFESFERGIQHPQGVVGRFLDAAGVPPLPGLKLVRANEGRSDGATRLISATRQALAPGRVDADRTAQEAEDATILAQLARLPGAKFRLRRDEIAPLLPQLAAENEWLKATFGDDFHDPAPDFADTPSPWDDESLERVAQILSGASPGIRRAVETYLRSAGFPLRSATTTHAASQPSSARNR